MEISKGFVLLSGGIDSTTCLAIAMVKGQVEAISVDYGQRHRTEIERAKQICNYYGVAHSVIDLKSIIPKTMLTDPQQQIPRISYGDIVGVSPMYVPFRNGLMLSALTSVISGRYEIESGQGEWELYFGAHAEDAANWAYPDCGFEFTGAMANAIYIGSYRKVRLVVPLQWMVKSQVIAEGNRLGVPFELTWSCYGGGERHCGQCATCRSRRQGFIDAGVRDRTEYAEVQAA